MPEGYTPEQQRAGQRVMIAEGIFARAMESFIGGVVLAGFAIALGANDIEIGLIAAIPFLTQLVHLPAVLMLARSPDRRAFAVRAALSARVMLFLIALVPLVALPLRPVHALIPLLVVYATLANLSGAAWQVWIRDLVPRDTLGSYFGRRMAILSAVGLVTTLAAGQFVTFWRTSFPESSMLAFVILFVVGGILGVISALVLRTGPIIHAEKADIDLVGTLKRPLADHNYRRVLVFLAAWGFAANFSLPFVSVVLLKTLGYSLSVVVLFAALSTATNVMGLRLWAGITDAFGNKPVLGLGASVFILAVFGWAIVPKEPGVLVLTAAAIFHILLGLAAAALDLASNGVVMKMAPDEDVPAYLSTASVAKSLATGIAPLLGGLVAALLVERAFTLQLGFAGPVKDHVFTALRFEHYDFLFLVSSIVGLYAIHRLLGFEEQGEAPRHAVVRALKREVGQFSSVAGLRQFAHVASYVVDAAYRVERTLDVRRRRYQEDEEGMGE